MKSKKKRIHRTGADHDFTPTSEVKLQSGKKNVTKQEGEKTKKDYQVTRN